jgi:hypothetical protein
MIALMIALPFVIVWYLFMVGAMVYVARERGRGPIAFFLCALVMSPLVAWMLLIALPIRDKARQPMSPADIARTTIIVVMILFAIYFFTFAHPLFVFPQN